MSWEKDKITPSKQCLIELKEMFLWDEIWRWVSRVTYWCWKESVMKFEIRQEHFCNINEWQVWNSIKEDKDISKRFAPCEMISWNWSWLKMKYVRDVSAWDKLPDKIPAFLCDLHTSNFWFIWKQMVCRDYWFFDHTQFRKKRMVVNKDLKYWQAEMPGFKK